jgi:hypothetical protein
LVAAKAKSAWLVFEKKNRSFCLFVCLGVCELRYYAFHTSCVGFGRAPLTGDKLQPDPEFYARFAHIKDTDRSVSFTTHIRWPSQSCLFTTQFGFIFAVTLPPLPAHQSSVYHCCYSLPTSLWVVERRTLGKSLITFKFELVWTCKNLCTIAQKPPQNTLGRRANVAMVALMDEVVGNVTASEPF